MPFEVYGPDGKSVTFPDGTDDATVVRVMGGIYPSAAAPAAAPAGKTPSIDDTNLFRDVPGALVSGVGELVQFPANVYGLTTGDFDTTLSRAGRGITEFGEDIKSEGLRERERLAQERIAAQEGFLGEAGQAAKEYASDPRLLMSGLLSSVPSMLGGLGVGALAGKGVSKIAGRKAAEEAAKATGRKAAVAGGIGAAAAEQGASVGRDTYNRVAELPEKVLTQSPDYQSMLTAGTSPEDARQELALSAARKAATAATALSAVSASLLPRAIEKTVFGDAVTDGVIKRSLKSFAGEATQEGLEEGGGQLAQNLAVSQADITADPFKGVGAATAQGALLGGAFGAPIGAFSGRARTATPDQEPPLVSPEIQAEFQNLAAQQIAAVMAADPSLTQEQAYEQVIPQSLALLDQARTNVELTEVQAQAGAAGGPDVDVTGAAGPSVPSDSGAVGAGAAAEAAGRAQAGGMGAARVPAGTIAVGEDIQQRPLTPITGKQITATIPVIEEAFKASAIDFGDMGVTKLSPEQKKQAARIVLESPGVAPYDAIGSVIERGMQLRGEKVPSRATAAPSATVTGPPNAQKLQDELNTRLTAINAKADEERAAIQAQSSAMAAPPLDQQATAPVKAAPAPTYTPQEIAGNLQSFGAQEASNRGYKANTPAYGMFIEGVRSLNPEVGLIADELILEKEGPETLAAYKEGLQWGQERIAEAQAPAAPIEIEAELTPESLIAEIEQAETDGFITPALATSARTMVQTNQTPLPAIKENLDKLVSNQANRRMESGQTVEAEADILAPARGEMKLPARNVAVSPVAERLVDTAIKGVKIPAGVGVKELGAIKRQATNQISQRLAKAQAQGRPDETIDAPIMVDALLRGKGFAIPERTVAPAAAPEAAAAPAPKQAKAVGTKGVKAKQVKAAILRKPGKTVAEKLFNMAQVEFDQTPKEDIIEQITPYTPEYETIRARPGINATRMAKMLGPQLYGDPTNMGDVCIKEVLQNSFDATRTAVDNGQVAQGKIDIAVSDNGRKLTVKDNGIGMTPELLGGKFLEIAGTAKEGDKNAGGFGIAKMLFLYANKNIRVSTARDGRIAEMDVTGEQLFAALDDPSQAPDITIRDLEPVDSLAFPDGHGTIIQLTIPEESGDYKIRELSHWVANIPSVVHSPLFADIAVTFQGKSSYNSNSVEIGANFPIQDYTQFVGVKFPWGSAKVYVTREQTGQKYDENMYILSNGLWQFSTIVKKNPTGYADDPVPYRFYVDIVPSVKPDEPGYPFNFNRKSFTDDAKADFNKVKSYIDAIYAYKSRAGDAVSFGSIQYFDANGMLGPTIDLTPDIPVQDTAFTRVAIGDQITVGADGSLLVNGQPMPELTPDQLKAGIPSASDLTVNPDLIDTDSVMVHDNADVVIKSTGEKLSIPDFMRRQFGERFDAFMLFNGDTFLSLRDEVARVMGYSDLRNEAIGVSFDPEYRGVSIRLPFSGSFINPLVPVYADGARAGFGIFGTMIHELAHHKVRSHNANFPAEMQNILLNMEADEGFNYQRFKENFADTIANQYGDIVKLGVELFNGKNPDISVEYRGNRFTDGSGEQVPDGAGDSGAGDVRGPRREGGTGEPLLGPSYERTRGPRARRNAGAGAKGGAQPITPATVAAAVKLTKAQIRQLEQAAGIRRMDTTKMQARILRSRSAEETLSLTGKLALLARKRGDDSGLFTSLFNSMPTGVFQAALSPQMTEDVVRIANAAGLKNVQRIDDLMRSEYIPYVNRLMLEATRVSDKLADFLSRNELGGKALTDVIIYANMVNVDPALADNPIEYMKLDSELKDLATQLYNEIDPKKQQALKVSMGVRRGEITRVYNGGKDAATNEIVYGWNDLSRSEFGSGAGKSIFRELIGHHRKSFDEHYRLLMQRINDAKLEPDDAKKLKDSVNKMFIKAKQRVIYFPLKRFGEYWVSIGKGKGAEFHMFESASAQQAFMSGLDKASEDRAISSGSTRASLRGAVADKTASAALKGILDLLDEGKITDVDLIKDHVFQMYLTALPEADMRRRFIQRKFTTGFSTDVLRTFASTSIAAANQLGRLAYNYKFEGLIRQGYAETEGKPSKGKLDTLTREMELRIKGTLSPDPTNWLDTLLSIGAKSTFYFILSAPATAFLNLTQLHMVGLPVLSGEFGEAATYAMATRYTGVLLNDARVGTPFRDADGNVKLQMPKLTLENSARLRSLKKSDPARYAETMEAWRFASENDTTQSTFAAAGDLYERSSKPSDKFSFTQSVRRGDTVSAAQRATANIIQNMGVLFHTTERIGREVMYMSTFDLAYERAIKQKKSPTEAGKEARELAHKLTNTAMFDFSNWNKSRLAKSRAGKLPLQMLSFSQAASSLMLRSFVGMLPLMNKEGKLAAARVFFGMQAMAMLYGGFAASILTPLALGAYGIYEGLKSLLGDEDDEEEEVEGGYITDATLQQELLKFADDKGRELSKFDMMYYIKSAWIPETFGPGGTLPTALGIDIDSAAMLKKVADIGLPALFDVDISKSVSLGDLWHSAELKSDDPETAFYEWLGRKIGPVGSVVTAPIRFVKEANAGNYDKAFEALLPVAYRNIAKAQRLQEEGLLIGKNRDIVLQDPSFYDAYTVMMQSAGFKEADTSRAMQVDIMAGDIEQEVGGQATNLLDQRYRAALDFNKNPTAENLKELKRVERDIKIYNLNFPSNTITEEDKDTSFQSKASMAAERAYGTGYNPKIPVRQPLAERRAADRARE